MGVLYFAKVIQLTAIIDVREISGVFLWPQNLTQTKSLKYFQLFFNFLILFFFPTKIRICSTSVEPVNLFVCCFLYFLTRTEYIYLKLYWDLLGISLIVKNARKGRLAFRFVVNFSHCCLSVFYVTLFFESNSVFLH